MVQPGFGVGFLLVGFQICCLGWQVTRVAVLGGQVVTGGQVCVGARARLWVGSWVGGKWTGCSCFLIGWAGSGQAALCVLVTGAVGKPRGGLWAAWVGKSSLLIGQAGWAGWVGGGQAAFCQFSQAGGRSRLYCCGGYFRLLSWAKFGD